MNCGHHQCIINEWRYKWRLLLLSVELSATLVFLSTLAFAQAPIGNPTPVGVVCTLSESQTQKSIEAFSKIASVLTQEPRCRNCHGGVNPFMDGFGEEDPPPKSADDVVVPSLTEHGGGKMDRRVPPSASNPKGSPESDCGECHSKMARRTSDGRESKWMTAPDFLAFIGKDPPTLCKQIRDILHNAKDFLGHIKDDNGGNNFAGTAFNGDRGLDRTMFSEKEVPTQKPRITHAALMKLGHDWVDSTGGEFKGDKSCGCEPAHYAIRYSTSTKINLADIEHSSGMDPADIPITFKDDGTFTGEGKGTYKAGGIAEGCTEQSALDVAFHVSGKATETSEKQAMHIELAYQSPMAYNFSAQCPDSEGDSFQATLPSSNVSSFFDLKGEVGEAIDKTEDSTPGIISKMHLEIVKKE